MTLRSLICAAAIAAAVVDTVAGCRDLPLAPSRVLPDLPVGAETLTPLATYADWWQSVEDCAGRRGDISRVRWFTMPDRTSFVYGDSRYDGYWWGGVHWILIAGEKVSDGMIVRHEMLHELLGRGDHPPDYFQGRCAEIVACTEMCRSGD